MKTKLRTYLYGVPLLCIALMVAGIVAAQSGGGYDLTWWTVDGGGGTVSGGEYTMMATAGQADVAAAITGGNYVLHSGFWAGGAVVTSTCDVSLTGVALSGPSSGVIGEILTFDAAPQPANATTPVDYAWSADGLLSGQGTSQATYRWDDAGDKNVQVAARNCGGQDFSDSQAVTIMPVCTRPITDVIITGLDAGYTDVDYNFTADPQPFDVSFPITYTWSSDGLVSGQDTPDATYNWPMTGTHTISITAENCGGLVTADHTITLSAQTVCTTPITSVSIDGPVGVDKDKDVVFTATLVPPDVTLPIDYVWSSTNLIGGQGTANATYRWSQSGAYTITLSAGNCGGAKNASHRVEVAQETLYLPLVMRDL